jgi:hypothetical protein
MHTLLGHSSQCNCSNSLPASLLRGLHTEKPSVLQQEEEEATAAAAGARASYLLLVSC